MAIDGYQHLGMPRFQTAEDALRVMAANGVEKSIVCPFESCPDLAMVHAAFSERPHVFRGAGLPLGADRAETTAGLVAQFEAGFAGIRLSGADVAERHWLLDTIGEQHGFALVCGGDGLASGATALLRYLDAFDDGLVVAAHLAGPTDVAVFDDDAAVAELFAHPRFSVVMSRQGHFPEPLVTDWADALVERVGWSRLMWGSEAPVLYWRDDSVANALAWFDRFGLDDETRAALMTGNAQRLVFDRPVAEPAPLLLPFDPWRFDLHNLVPTWPFGLPMRTELVGPLVHAWMEWGGSERGPLREYLDGLLEKELIR
jgi:hypothetical protein